MERRLIFFSGGLDSTALLTMSTPDDIIVTIVDVPDQKYNWFHDVDVEKVKKIAKHFNRFIYFNPVHIPHVEIEQGVGVDQTNVFFSVANNWARIKGKSLKEVWWGVYDLEYQNNVVNQKLRNDWFKAWEILHPNIKFHNPLGSSTKVEAWKMIPDEVKPLVTPCRAIPKGDPETCICHKCIQHRKGISGMYSGAWKRALIPEGKYIGNYILYDPSGESEVVFLIKGN
jgi:7-cyano-7-deazaguanine synthase in queuosine biosynthesis